jgi:ribosomal protein S24E
MRVTYVCNQLKELRIGKHVKFVGGEFSTEDEDIQRLIERNDIFGTSIHYQDDPTPEREKVKREIEARAKAVEEEALLQQLEAEDKAQADAKVKEEDEARQKLLAEMDAERKNQVKAQTAKKEKHIENSR